MKHRESEQTQLRVSRLLNRDSVMLHAEMPSVQTALETLVELQESNGVITNGTAYYFGSPCQPAQRPPPDGKTAYGGYARGVYPHPEPDRSGNLCINEAKTARNTKAIQHPIAETEKNIIL